MSLPQEILGVIRGLQAVVQAGIKLQESSLRATMQNSSLKTSIEEYFVKAKKVPANNTSQNTDDFIKILRDSGDRLYTVIDGINEFISYSIKSSAPKDLRTAFSRNPQPEIKPKTSLYENNGHEIKLTASDKELLKKLDMEHREKLKASAALTATATTVATAATDDNQKIENQNVVEEKAKKIVNPDHKIKSNDEYKEKSSKIKAIPNPKSKQSLNILSKERTVPSSRIARMVSFGSLAAGLGIGTAAEFMRRTIGMGNSTDSNVFLTKANMDRIADTLCKVRGAALKIGQMLSIQDESIVSPELAQALERVRKSADFMPTWQVQSVLRTEIGDTWQSLLSEFEEKPFAAASIGQVHWGKTLDNQEVAIKIQYPGVAKGIESDIDNLVGIMKVWNIFPRGMFIDNVVTVAKRELAWEVDYVREAECTKKFKQMLKPYQDYYVPEVVDQLCSSQVFTTEYVEGIPLDQCTNLDFEHRKFIANKILELCLRELMEFRYMQTDPNWANFLYNPKTKKMLLLDFGASREYSKPFVDKYIKVMKAASENNREQVLIISRELGFLTGYESKQMEDAHVDAVMILGEVLQQSGEYNFKGSGIILRIQNLVQTMLDHRLCPPPDEIYSLHRKLSGIYLLCAKLDAPVSATSLFLNLYNEYKFDNL